MAHLFVLEKATYTYKNTVTSKTKHPTHLLVICSVPTAPWGNYKIHFARSKIFHYVLCLERSERNGYKNGNFLGAINFYFYNYPAYQQMYLLEYSINHSIGISFCDVIKNKEYFGKHNYIAILPSDIANEIEKITN